MAAVYDGHLVIWNTFTVQLLNFLHDTTCLVHDVFVSDDFWPEIFSRSFSLLRKVFGELWQCRKKSLFVFSDDFSGDVKYRLRTSVIVFKDNDLRLEGFVILEDIVCARPLKPEDGLVIVTHYKKIGLFYVFILGQCKKKVVLRPIGILVFVCKNELIFFLIHQQKVFIFFQDFQNPVDGIVEIDQASFFQLPVVFRKKWGAMVGKIIGCQFFYDISFEHSLGFSPGGEVCRIFFSLFYIVFNFCFYKFR